MTKCRCVRVILESLESLLDGEKEAGEWANAIEETRWEFAVNKWERKVETKEGRAGAEARLKGRPV